MVNLKKTALMAATGMLVLVLAACGEPVVAPEPDNDDSASESEGAEEETAMTAEEVFMNSTEAYEEVNSLHADIVTDQVMNMMPEGMEIKMNVASATDMTLDPREFHQTSETTIVSEDIENENPMSMQIFHTEDGMYFYESSMDAWLKMPEESIDDLQGLADQQTTDPTHQLGELAAFQEDFELEETADEYILTLDATGDEFKTLLDRQLEKTLGQMEIEAQMVMENMVIHAADYEIFIDKGSNLVNRMNIGMNLDIEIQGEEMNIESDIQAEYSDYNEIEQITVPAEVIEQAEEIPY